MEEKIWKSAFDRLELKKEAKEQVWERIVQKNAVNRTETVGIPYKKGRGEKGCSYRRWAAAAVLCSFLLGVVFINIQTEGKILKEVQRLWKADKPSRKIIERTVSYQFDSVDAPKLIDCSETRLLFASTMGLVVYDREHKRVVGTIDLKEIECFYLNEEEESVRTCFLPEGEQLTIYNHISGKNIEGNCYIYNLAGCSSVKEGEVKALEPDKKVPVTPALEERWKEKSKKSQRSTFENKIYTHFRQEIDKAANQGGMFFSSQTISWRSEKGEKYYSCLAFTELGKKERQLILCTKNRDTGKLEKEFLKLKANIEDGEEEVLPVYECRTKEPIRKALALCAKENLSRYCGKFYHSRSKCTLDDGYPDNMPVLPIISIYAVREGRKYTKVYGAFTTLGLTCSGDILYEKNFTDTLGYGCAYLKKTADGYRVEKILHPRDGAYLAQDMRDMCDGDEALFQKVSKQHDRGWKIYQKEIKKMVEEYVTENGLDIRYFKENGKNLMKLGEE